MRKLFFKEGSPGAEIDIILKTVYGATCDFKRTVFSWMQDVKLGEIIFVDAPSIFSRFFGVEKDRWSPNGWIQMNHTKIFSRTPFHRRYP
jgi:hypothetical protein